MRRRFSVDIIARQHRAAIDRHATEVPRTGAARPIGGCRTAN
jgi:hypothetical protein